MVLTALMLIVITFWAWQTWHWLDDHELGRARHDASKISDILLGALCALDQNGQLGREEIEQRFGDILETSRYQFLILIQDGRRVIQAGEIPAGLPSAFKERAFFLGDTFILSRQVRLPNHITGKRSRQLDSGREATGSGIINGDYLAVLGGDGRRDKMPTIVFVEHIIVPFAAVLLILSANAAAWIMVIRNRSLFEQLEIERTRSAHLEDLGLAASGLAHETKNPLGIISGIAQQVARDPRVPEKSRAMLETIIDEIDKSVSRLGLFMTYARQREVTVAPVDARQSIQGIAGVLEPEFDAAGIVLKMESSALTIMADEEMFRQILVNLLLNSLTASSPGGTVIIRMQRHGRHASVEVEDQGSGISEELLPRIFKPYVTGTPDGHGLGLAIVKRFAEDQGWAVSAESEPGKGTVIRISRISISEISEDA